MTKHLLAAALLIALAAAAPASAETAEEAVAAERAFAAAASRDGVAPAFRATAAPDALLFAPDPVPAQAELARWPEGGAGSLLWAPSLTAVARSGDLAFNTGPYVMRRPGGETRGWFFTLWRRQPDGGWRWLIDKGVDAPTTSTRNPPAADAPVQMLAAAWGGRSSAEEASRRVRVLDAALNTAAAGGTAAAYREHLARDVRLAADGRDPTTGRSAAEAELAARPARLEMQPLGDGASSDGDLVYTYGHARWSTPEGVARRGHYVRVWRHAGRTWELVFDQLAAVPEARPAAAG